MHLATSSVFECAHCGFDYTHFDLIGMAARPLGEDEVVEVIQVTSHGEVSRRIAEREENPGIYNSRRHSMWLRGTCENCDYVTIVAFVQYKGQTLIAVTAEKE